MFNLESKLNILSKEDFKLFQQLILQEIGIYFRDDQRKSLSLSLSERIQENKIHSFRDYYNLLGCYPEGRVELSNLLDLITIGETYFLRSPAHFDVLRKFILPEIMQNKSDFLNKSLSSGIFSSGESLIKIWSAGCSTGEEAYSIAISLLEAIPEAFHGAVSIYASDVNRQRLDAARAGLYNKRAVRNLDPQTLDKYFIKTGDSYELSDTVKRMVRFRQHNLAKDGFDLEYIKDLDIIFCRNVLIYFDLSITRRIIDNFYNCLNNEGYLFIGPAESLWQISDKFRPVEFPHIFVYKKQLAPVPAIDKPLITVPELNLESIEFKEEESKAPFSEMAEEAVKREEISRQACEVDYREGIKLFNQKQYDMALNAFDELIKCNPKFTRAYFAKATILSNQGRYKDAMEELKKIIEIDNLFIEAYYLMGVLLNRLGDLDKAKEEFKKVIYIDPEIVLAHFNLGNIFYCQKKFKSAEREFKNTLNILEHSPKEEIVAFSEDITVELLLISCKKNIEMVRSG